jgi:ribokinase
MAGKRIAVVGSSNTDMIIQLPKIPLPGQTVLGGRFTMAAGGKGANQAVAAARAGGLVHFIARVGEDVFGTRAVQSLKSDGIDVSGVFRDPGEPSGTALIFVEESGENCIAVASGSNAKLSQDDIQRARHVLVSADILLMQLEIPIAAVQAAAEVASASGTTVILNPAPAAPLPRELLSHVSILTPNESEAEVLTGVDLREDGALNRAAEVLMEQGVSCVLITLGARGAFIASGTTREIIPGFEVTAVDSTAAGDVFNGALAVALAEGTDLRSAVRFANGAAALSVTRLGAQPSIPVRSEVDRFLSEKTHG